MGVAGRLFDLVVSSVLLVLTAPIFLVAAILIKLDSAGPVFFLQERIGRGGRPFRMLKFRKMHHVTGASNGPGITSRYDARVTRVGSWLERTKLDELPQLVNVLLGTMSVVGPRPEIPRFVGDPHRELWERVLAVKPGIFGPNQITHRNESELFPEDCQDVEAWYVQHILPGKLEVDAAYAARKSLLRDLWIIVCGLWVSFFGSVTGETIRTRRGQIAYLLGCVLLGELTLVAAFFLRFNWRIPARDFRYLTHGLLLMGAARLVVFFHFRVHRSLHAYFSLSDALRICASTAVGSLLGIVGLILLNFRALSRSVVIMDTVMLTVLLIAASYLIDRSLGLLKRQREQELRSLWSYTGWSAAAGAAGVVSMLYALAFVWPGAFADHWLALSAILGMTFAGRFLLFPFLCRGLPPSDDFVATVTQRGRPILAHLTLAFVADVTTVFFLDIRDFSRGAVIVNTFFYALLLLLVITLRCAGNRRPGVAAAAGSNSAREVRRILLVGDGREMSLLLAAVRDEGRGALKAVGVVSGDPENRTHHVQGIEVIGTTRAMPALLKAKEPSLVMVLKNTITRPALRQVVQACHEARIDVRLLPSIAELAGVSNGNGSGPRNRIQEME